MEVLFLNYANSQASPLPSLKQEDDAVYRALTPRALRQHYLLHRDSFSSIEQVAEYLTLYRNHITIFHYSGHAGRDTLVLEGEEQAQAAGIAHLMGQCKRLKLVVLNGCSTRGQVEALLEQGVPVVIATSVPVEDQRAARFATRFYQALAQSSSIGEAFELAIGEILTMDSTVKEKVGRGMDFRSGKGPVWGIYYREEHKRLLEEVLPSRSVLPVPEDYTPNERLIEALWSGLKNYDKEIKLPGKSRLENPLKSKSKLILSNWPAPVAEHLRRLMANTEGDDEGFDQVGMVRLKQIALTYQTAMEMLAFTLTAQLWEIGLKKGKLQISSKQQEEILGFLTLKQEEQQAYDYLRFIRHLRELIDAEGGEYFIEELREVKGLLYQEGDFQTACFFLEVLRIKVYRQTVELAEIQELCIRAEESLATILAEISFVAKYALVAIQDIDVLKFRHDPEEPHFNHYVVALRDLHGGYKGVIQLDLMHCMVNRSIILFNEETEEFLSLSPFIIDANSFKKKAKMAKVYFLSHYEQLGDAYCFKYINRPEDSQSDIRVTKRDFSIVKVQLEAFKNLIAPAV